MRPIERRIAAVEARQPAENPNIRVFIERPEIVDREAFRRECHAEAAGARIIFVTFVDPGDRRSSSTALN